MNDWQEAKWKLLLAVPRWEFATEGWHTDALETRLDEGWEPFGFSDGIVALRRQTTREAVQATKGTEAKCKPMK